MRRRTQRKGFTLIELLIVIVIIGILAAIAIPKFGATRERAFLKAMESDLRNLITQQELYYSLPENAYSYAGDGDADELDGLDFQSSSGVTVAVSHASGTGWAATAVHTALPHATCAVFMGLEAGPEPAENPGVITCTDAEGEPEDPPEE